MIEKLLLMFCICFCFRSDVPDAQHNLQEETADPEIREVDHDSQLPLLDNQLPLHDSQLPLHDSQLPLHDNQLPLHDSRLPLQDSQLPLVHNIPLSYQCVDQLTPRDSTDSQGGMQCPSSHFQGASQLFSERLNFLKVDVDYDQNTQVADFEDTLFNSHEVQETNEDTVEESLDLDEENDELVTLNINKDEKAENCQETDGNAISVDVIQYNRNINNTSDRNIDRGKVPTSETHMSDKCKKVDVFNGDNIRQTSNLVESTSCTETFGFLKLDAACCQDSNIVNFEKIIVHTTEFKLLNEESKRSETFEDSNCNKGVHICNMDKCSVMFNNEEGSGLINDSFIGREDDEIKRTHANLDLIRSTKVDNDGRSSKPAASRNINISSFVMKNPGASTEVQGKVNYSATKDLNQNNEEPYIKSNFQSIQIEGTKNCEFYKQAAICSPGSGTFDFEDCALKLKGSNEDSEVKKCETNKEMPSLYSNVKKPNHKNRPVLIQGDYCVEKAMAVESLCKTKDDNNLKQEVNTIADDQPFSCKNRMVHLETPVPELSYTSGLNVFRLKSGSYRFERKGQNSNSESDTNCQKAMNSKTSERLRINRREKQYDSNTHQSDKNDNWIKLIESKDVNMQCFS